MGPEGWPIQTFVCNRYKHRYNRYETEHERVRWAILWSDRGALIANSDDFDQSCNQKYVIYWQLSWYLSLQPVDIGVAG